jgi:hypothetical protein
MEGILTCILAVGAWFIIVDFPEDSPQSWHFLNEAEATWVVARIEKDRSDTFPDKFSVGKYLRNALDSKVWAFAWLYMLTTTNSYAIAYFLPIILRSGMNFSVAAAQCLTAPPYVAAAIVMFVESYYADKWRVRGLVVVGNALMGKVIPSRAPLYRLTLLQAFLVWACWDTFTTTVSAISASSWRRQHVSKMWLRRCLDSQLTRKLPGNANCPALITYQG